MTAGPDYARGEGLVSSSEEESDIEETVPEGKCLNAQQMLSAPCALGEIRCDKKLMLKWCRSRLTKVKYW